MELRVLVPVLTIIKYSTQQANNPSANKNEEARMQLIDIYDCVRVSLRSSSRLAQRWPEAETSKPLSSMGKRLKGSCTCADKTQWHHLRFIRCVQSAMTFANYPSSAGREGGGGGCKRDS